MTPLALARLYRVLDWVHFLPLPLLVPAQWTVWLAAMVAFAGALAYAAAINNAFDSVSDDPRGRKNPVAGGLISRRTALWLAWPPAVVSLLATRFLPPRGLVAVCVLLLCATLYSAPPRFKSKPVLGSVWNLLVFAPGAFLCGWPSEWLLFSLFALLLLASQLLHEVVDYAEDVASGVCTTAVVIGARTTQQIGAALVLAVPFIPVVGGGSRVVAGISLLFASCWAPLYWKGEPQRLRIAFRCSVLIFGASVWWATFRAYP